MPTGGKVRLTARLEERMVHLIVSDEGSGIAPSERARVFEPFYTTKSERGTGLGLAVSHSLVTAVGGRIDVVDDVGPGAALRVTLPVATQPCEI